MSQLFVADISMNKRKVERGQSLIELIVVIMLITVAMTSGILMVMRSLQLSEVSLNRQRAVGLAKTASEFIKKEKEMNDWLVFTNGVKDAFANSGNYLIDVDVIDTDFDVVTNEYDDTTDGEMDIDFSVTWIDLKGDHTLEDNVLLYRY